MSHTDHELVDAKDRARNAPAREPADRPAGWISAVGNAAAAGVLHRAAQPGDRAAVDPAVASAINARRGAGTDLDPGVREDLSPELGDDLADVRVHTDGEADRLSRAVRAEAFTTGRDVFFRAGRYDPASNEGRKLLAHELTHVVQQRGALPAAELAISDPAEPSERQAAAVAERVALPAPAPAPAGALARQEDMADVQTMAVARQEDEEPEAPEEEVAQTPVARQESEEEEE
jgi:hypothetical protein